MAELKTLIGRYEEIRARKDELADLTKENNAAFEEIKQQIADQMIEDDCPSISVGGYSYSLQNKTKYNFISAEKLAQMQVDKFEVLRENGFGYLITETVNQRTLDSTMNEIAENGEIPEDLDAILSKYEVNDIGRRKASSKSLKKAKEAKGEE
jgi:hypothetical protein